MNIGTGYLVALALALALAVPIVNSLTDTSADRRGLALKPRLLAAGWFALAALIPVIIFWLIAVPYALQAFADDTYAWPSVLWIFAGLPVLAASFCGFIRGSSILDRQRVKTDFQSVLRGLVVGIFAYSVFGASVIAQALIYGDSVTRQLLLYGILFFLGAGAVVIGWLILIITGLAGWLLYRLSLTGRTQRLLANAGRVSRSVAINWTVAAILLFHICSLPGSITVGAGMRKAVLKERNRTLNSYLYGYYGSEDLLLAAIGEGADVNNLDFGQRPIAIAVRGHYSERIKALLDHGADPNLVEEQGSKNTVIFYVATGSDLEALNILLDHGAKVNVAGNEAHTPLMNAARWGSPEIVSALLAHGAEVNARNIRDKTALGLALEIKETLMTQRPAEHSEYSNQFDLNETRKRRSEVIRMLRAAGAKE
jgi:MFS family permease